MKKICPPFDSNGSSLTNVSTKSSHNVTSEVSTDSDAKSSPVISKATDVPLSPKHSDVLENVPNKGPKILVTPASPQALSSAHTPTSARSIASPSRSSIISSTPAADEQIAENDGRIRYSVADMLRLLKVRFQRVVWSSSEAVVLCMRMSDSQRVVVFGYY